MFHKKSLSNSFDKDNVVFNFNTMEKQKPQKILFIYNANSGKFNALFDSIHKIVSPKTYKCSLCDITYGIVTENKLWKKFRKESDIEMDFLHKDEFLNEYTDKFGHKFTLPVVLIPINNELQVFISTDEINKLKNAEELIKIVKERLLI